MDRDDELKASNKLINALGDVIRTVEEIRVLGGQALAVRADVSNEQDVEEMVQKTLEKFGQVDILVNNAAVNYYAPLREMPIKRWDLVMRVNLRGIFLCTKATLPKMMEWRKGNIINFSSMVARHPEWKNPDVPYAVTKAGIERFTIGLAEEVKGYNIAVNALVPYHTITEGMKLWHPGVDASDWQKPEMWGECAVFLGSQDAGTLTGKVLSAEGIRGEAARLGWSFFESW